MEYLKFITYISILLWLFLIFGFFIFSFLLFYLFKNESIEKNGKKNRRNKGLIFNDIQNIDKGDIIYYKGIKELSYEVLSCDDKHCDLKRNDSDFKSRALISYIKKEYTKQPDQDS